jgi:F-type H+-transporting ATPase subunit a
VIDGTVPAAQNDERGEGRDDGESKHVQDASEARPARTRSRYLPLWIALVAILVADVLAALVVGFPGYPAIEIEPIAPHVLFPVGPFTITNSLLTMWIIEAVILVLGIALTRRLAQVPGTVQNLVEWIYQSLADFVVSLGGPAARRYAPLFIALFIFILLSNWSGVIPFFGKVEWLRAPTSDLNVTAGLAIVSFFVFHVEGIRVLGVRGYFGKYINLRGFRHGPVDGAIDLFVGLLEGLLEFLKPVTLALRLFGNVWGGEVMLAVMTALLLAILPLPFLGLELFIGLIQAFIFAILTLVFTVLALESHGEEHEEQPAIEEHAEGSPAGAVAAA